MNITVESDYSKKRDDWFEDLCEMQDDLNQSMIPNWKNILTVDHFKTQVLMELSELIDSGYEYKWWKKGAEKVDLHNSKIEVVDIAHFIFSMFVLRRSESSGNAYIITGIKTNNSDVPMGRDNLFSYDNKLNHTEYMNIVSDILKGSWYDALLSLMGSVGLSYKELYIYYLAKHTLNDFRQKNGYKNGTYEKRINDVEDNEVLEKLCIDQINKSEPIDKKQFRDLVLTHLENWKNGYY